MSCSRTVVEESEVRRRASRDSKRSSGCRYSDLHSCHTGETHSHKRFNKGKPDLRERQAALGSSLKLGAYVARRRIEAVMTAVELTLLEALCRSRQQILNELLPVFKSKRRSVKPGRRGAVPPEPPVHTLSALCTTNVVIGPHTFRHSKLYAADWGTGGATKRRMSSAASSAGPAALTPAMIARLNAASAVDSSLASILRKAATGSANAKELAQLAREIEKLRAEDAALAAGNADQPVASTSKNVSGEDKSNDPPAIVIEFAEAPEELYQVPSHYMFSALPNARSETRRSAGAPSASDALLSFFVFASDEEGTPDAIPVPVDLIVEGLSQDVSSELLQCSRAGRPKNAKLEKWWKEMVSCVRCGACYGFG